MNAYELKPNDNKEDNRIGFTVIIMMLILAAILVLTSCGSVKKLSDNKKSDSTSVTVVDTVHVKKYDTSTVTHEVTNYTTKTVELYDTILTKKDSIVTVLKSRTIYAEGNTDLTQTKAGKGIDSSSSKAATTTEVKKQEEIKTKDKSGQTPFWIWVVFAIAFMALGFYVRTLFSPAKIITSVEDEYNKVKTGFLKKL